jgi:hypothetical protein
MEGIIDSEFSDASELGTLLTGCVAVEEVKLAVITLSLRVYESAF